MVCRIVLSDLNIRLNLKSNVEEEKNCKFNLGVDFVIRNENYKKSYNLANTV